MREEREEREEDIEGVGSIFLLVHCVVFRRIEEKGRSASFSFFPVFSRRFSFKDFSRCRHAHFFSLEIRKGKKVLTAFYRGGSLLVTDLHAVTRCTYTRRE